MTRTGVDSLDRSIDKTNAWLADVAANFGTEDRRMAYRVTRSWLHTLRDRLPVPIAAHIAAQLPELLRGVFYEGWNPSKVPIKYSRDEYIARFARDAQLHQTEVPRAGRLVTSAMQKHISPGAINEVLGALPTDIRSLVAPTDAEGAREGAPEGAADGAGRPSAPGGISQTDRRTSQTDRRTRQTGKSSHPRPGGDQDRAGVPRQAGAPSEGGMESQSGAPSQGGMQSKIAGPGPGGGEQ